MSLPLSAVQTPAPADARERGIQPLPADVVAQLKSSTAITSLSHVVLELLKNSLDAKASTVDATVDFARGGCIVEDDGLGIAPREFREEGGLGKLYYTSKYNSHAPLLGRTGTFLACLAATSLLTLTSHHHEHRSHNSVLFHHSKALERQLPASSSNQQHGKHGTRVTVRNLFGNLPVRVKHRSLVLEQRTEHDRLWEALRRGVVAVLLSWRGTVSLRVRDSDHKVVFRFNTSKSTVTKTNLHNAITPRASQLSSMLNILTQANYIPVDEWTSWVPASAATTNISIKGAISLLPAPSKHTQFISLGIRPLTADSGHNELYDEVNRLFALSSFGTIEENDSVDDLEKVRRQSDKRYKNEGYTIKQLKARKDVDRYPVFHLRVSFSSSVRANTSEDRLIETETSLQAVIEVLRAMITQWLSVHHFCPRQFRRRRDRPGTASTSASTVIDSEGAAVFDSDAAMPVTTAAQTGLRSGTPMSRSDHTSSRKRKRATKSKFREESEKTQHQAFAEWSRIKSGKADFFKNLPTLPKVRSENGVETVHGENPRLDQDDGFAKFEMEPIPQGALSALSVPTTKSTTPSCIQTDEHDEIILWTDPSTGKTHLLNARTGFVVPNAQTRPHTVSNSPALPTSQKSMNEPLRLAPKTAASVPRETLWLDGVLQTWENPVFKPSEKRIQQVSLEIEEDSHSSHQMTHHHCSHVDVDKAFNEASTPNSGRLSKQGLRNAQVIAQVDKKFILVKMRSSPIVDSEDRLPADLLVLIDQHAADERIRVEALFQDLCTAMHDPPPPSKYRSQLGHAAHVVSVLLDKPMLFGVSVQERKHFVTHATRFAAWGILYNVLNSAPSTARLSANDGSVLSVMSLPPTISTRCTSDPKILISLLRSIVWSYASDPHLPAVPPTISVAKEADWVRRIATCPPALVDLIHSRACRSAIMFNDVLSREECEELVEKLSKCVFPFMCAHGRPSMVPLVEVGSPENGQGAAGLLEAEKKGNEEKQVGFVGMWKVWKGGME